MDEEIKIILNNIIKKVNLNSDKIKKIEGYIISNVGHCRPLESHIQFIGSGGNIITAPVSHNVVANSFFKVFLEEGELEKESLFRSSLEEIE